MEKNQEKFDLQLLLKQMKNFQIGIEKQKICGKVIALLGDTKAGKTTLLYYLTGQELELKKDQKTLITTMQATHIYHNAKISDTTSFPNIYSNEEDQWTVIDFPGFNDDRNLNKLLNIFILQQTFKKFSQVHFCFVIPKQLLEGIQLMKCIGQFNKLVNNDFIRQSNAFSVILTKTQDDDQTVKQNFLQLLSEIKEQVPQIKSFVQILESGEDNIFCFQNAKPDSQTGSQILNQILQNKSVLKFHNFTEIFNHKYVQAVIGQHKNSNFQGYLSGLIEQMTFILTSSLKLVQFLFRHVFYKFLLKIEGNPRQISSQEQKNVMFQVGKNVLGFLNTQDLINSLQDILNSKDQIIPQKSQNLAIQALLQLNKTYKLIQNQQNLKGMAKSFQKMIAGFTLLGGNFQFQSFSETKILGKTLKQLSKCLIVEVTLPIQYIQVKINSINPEDQDIKSKIDNLKNICEDSFKNTYQNLIDWKLLLQYAKQSKNRSPEKQKKKKSDIEVEIVKSRKQQIQEELQKYSKFSQQNQNQIRQIMRTPSHSQESEKYNKQKDKMTADYLKILKECIEKYQNKGAKVQDVKKFYGNLQKYKQVKNDQFLQFFLQNFLVLLQIFDEYDKWKLFKSIIQQKICPSLIKMNLLQEASLFAMSIPSILIVSKILQFNNKVHKLKKTFIEDKLIKFSIQMKSKSMLTKCYNELSCNYVEDRFLSSNNIYLANRLKLKQSIQKIQSSGNVVNLNFNLDYLQRISLADIMSKIKLIKERNQKCKFIYPLKKIMKQKTEKLEKL